MYRRKDHADAVQRAIAGLYTFANLEAFPTIVMQALNTIIQSDITSYTEVNVRRGRAVGVLDVPEAGFPGHTETLGRLVMQHPLIAHYQITGDGAAYRITDFVTQRQFEAGPVYQELYKKMDVRRQMAVTIQSSKPVLIGAIVNRRHKDFTERERRALNELRPHLARAYANAEAVTRTQEDHRLISQAIDTIGYGVVVVSPAWKIRSLAGTARQILSQFFEPSRSASELPPSLAAWVRQTIREPGAARHLTIDRNGRRIVARLLSRVANDTAHTIIFEHDQQFVPIQHLQAAGLTRREAEVLQLVEQGKSNDEIAAAVGASVRTIHKHMEHIFQKLGVQSRVAAAVRARRLGIGAV